MMGGASLSLPLLFVSALALALVLISNTAVADTFAPSLQISTSGAKGATNSEIYTGLKLSLMLSSLVLIVPLMMTATCFTRIAIVLSVTRQALGTAQTPPNQIILGLSIFLTFAIMGDVFNKVYTDAVVPYGENQIDNTEALRRGFAPLRTFMLQHTREQDLELFLDIQKIEAPEDSETLPATVVIPGFVLSELNSAFQISFLIYLPFLILDMIISSVLTSMSMITLPPTVISLPIKLMLFVMIDGWHLIIGNLIQSYHV